MLKKHKTQMHFANIMKVIFANLLLIIPFYFILAIMTPDTTYLTVVKAQFFFANNSLQAEVWIRIVILSPVVLLLFFFANSWNKRIYNHYKISSKASKFIEKHAKNTNNKLWNTVAIYSSIYVALILFFATYSLDSSVLEASINDANNMATHGVEIAIWETAAKGGMLFDIPLQVSSK